MHLALDPYEPGEHWPESRVFSIAGSSRERDRLAITYSVKGAFTARMEQELVPGRTVWAKLPYGEFVVDSASDAVLFAGGTGVTAFTAFLQSLDVNCDSRVLLCYGARKPDLFIYSPLIEACQRTVPTLTCALVCEETDGPIRVASVWPAIAALTDPVFYLSGPSDMLVALRSQLAERGIASGRIRTDAWE